MGWKMNLCFVLQTKEKYGKECKVSFVFIFQIMIMQHKSHVLNITLLHVRIFIHFLSLHFRSVLDPSLCFDGVQGQGCVLRRQRSVRPVAK